VGWAPLISLATLFLLTGVDDLLGRKKAAIPEPALADFLEPELGIFCIQSIVTTNRSWMAIENKYLTEIQLTESAQIVASSFLHYGVIVVVILVATRTAWLGEVGG